MKRRVISLSLLLVVVAFTSCDGSTPLPVTRVGANASGTLDKDAAGEWVLFGITIESAGDTIGVEVRGTLAHGTLSARLTSSKGQVVWERAFDKVGPFVVTTLLAPAPGRYDLGLFWDGPLLTSYALRWQPGEIAHVRASPIALVGGLGMIVVAIGCAAYAIVNSLGVEYLLFGALGWAIAVGLKSAWAVPVNGPLLMALEGALPKSLAEAIFCSYAGLLTGIFEVIPVWLLMRYSRLGRVSWPRPLAFGIGFGAIEALVLGILSLGTALVALVAPTMLPLGSAQSSQMNDILIQLAPPVERLAAVVVHAMTNALIFYGVARSEPRWLWASFLFKSALDVLAAFGQFWGLDTLAKVWIIEAGVAAFGATAWFALRGIRARYPRAVEG